MLKVVLAFITAVCILALAFVIVPRLLLKQSGTNAANTANVPVGRPLQPGATPSGFGATPAQRKIEAFSDIETAAGFRPLTPSSLPNGYQPWEQFWNASSNSVVLTYRKSERLYVIVVEQKDQPANGFRGRPPTLCPAAAGSPEPLPSPENRRAPVQRPLVPVGTACALYFSDAASGYSPGTRLFQTDGLSTASQDLQPHSLWFIAGGLQLAVEADENDITRDQLVQIAAGLR